MPRLPAAREEAAYRIAQEALHNALRHADATRISVVLRDLGAEGLSLVVADDGVGFSVDGVAPGGVGLGSMRARAEEVGGRLQVRSGPEGTTVELWAPSSTVGGTQMSEPDE